MIGFFDSGLGGLTILKEVVKLLPEYDYIYLGDNARTPYGSRSQDVIYNFTCEGVSELFRQGAILVILACNTSSSAALRKIQQEFLPKYFPRKNVLGIIIPTAEEINNFTKTKEVGVLATEATAKSQTYTKEINKRFPEVKVYEQPCPLLVPIIEAGEIEWEGLDLAIQKYLEELFNKSSKIDTVILGCTHYAIIEDKIRKYLPLTVKLVSQGRIVAKKLKDYLGRHKEIEIRLGKNGKRVFLTTEYSERIKNLAKLFYGEPINIKSINLTS